MSTVLSVLQLKSLGEALAKLPAESQLGTVHASLQLLPPSARTNLIFRVIEIARREQAITKEDFPLALALIRLAEYSFTDGLPLELNALTATLYEVVLPAIYRGIREESGEVETIGFLSYVHPFCVLLVEAISRQPGWMVKFIAGDLVALLRTARIFEPPRDKLQLQDPRLTEMAPAPQALVATLLPLLAAALGPIASDLSHPAHREAREALAQLCAELSGPATLALARPCKVLTRVILPSLLEVSRALCGPEQEDTVAQAVVDQCCTLLKEEGSTGEARHAALALLVEYGSLVGARGDLWGEVSRLLAHPDDALLRKKAQAVLEQGLGPHAQQEDPWRSYLTLLSMTDEHSAHLFEQHWAPCLDRIHAPAGALGASLLSQPSATVPAYSPAFEIALWRRAFRQGSPTILRLILASFLQRSWSPEHLASLDPEFIVCDLVPVFTSPAAYKVPAGASAEWVAWDSDLGHQLGDFLRIATSHFSFATNLEILRRVLEELNATDETSAFKGLGRIGLPVVLGVVAIIASALGSQRLQLSGPDSSPASDLVSLPTLVLQLLRLLLGRVAHQPGPLYRIKAHQLALKALQSTCTPETPGMDLSDVLMTLDALPEDLLSFNDALDTEIESWLFKSGKQSVNTLFEQLESHFALYLGSKPSNNAPRAADHSAALDPKRPISQAEFQSFRDEGRRIAKLVKALSVGCASDAVLVRDLQLLVKRLLEGLAIIYQRPYLPRGFPEKLLLFVTELALLFPPEDRSQLGASLCEIVCAASDDLCSFLDLTLTQARDAPAPASVASSSAAGLNGNKPPSRVPSYSAFSLLPLSRRQSTSTLADSPSSSSSSSSVPAIVPSASDLKAEDELRQQHYSGRAEVAASALASIARLLLNRLLVSKDSKLVTKIGAKIGSFQRALQGLLTKVAEFAVDARLPQYQRLCFLRVLHAAAMGMASVSGVAPGQWVEVLETVQLLARDVSDPDAIAGAPSREERVALANISEAKWRAVETVLSCLSSNGKRLVSLPIQLHAVLLKQALASAELAAEEDALVMCRAVRRLYQPILAPPSDVAPGLLEAICGQLDISAEATSPAEHYRALVAGVVTRVNKVLVSHLISLQRKALGPATLVLSTVLHPLAFAVLHPSVNPEDAAELQASSPLVLSSRQVSALGARSPRCARLAALQLSSALLQHPQCVPLFLKDLLALIFFEPYSNSGVPGDPEALVEAKGLGDGALLEDGGLAAPNAQSDFYATHELAPRVAVVSLISALADQSEAFPSTPLGDLSRAAGQLLLREVLGALRSKELSTPGYRNGSAIHRRKIRAMQALSALCRFENGSWGDVLAVVDHGAQVARDVPSVRSYLEIIAAFLISRQPELVDSWLLPRLRDYSLKPDAALTYVTVTTFVLMHVRLPQGTVTEMLALMTTRSNEHHQPLRCFTQVAFNILSERFQVIKPLTTSSSFGDALAYETRRMFSENPDLTRFFAKINTDVLHVPLAQLVTPKGIFATETTRLKGFSAADEVTGNAIFEGCPEPVLEAILTFLNHEREEIRKGLADLQAAKRAGLDSSAEVTEARLALASLSTASTVVQTKIDPHAPQGSTSTATALAGVAPEDGATWRLLRVLASLEQQKRGGRASAVPGEDEDQALRQQLIEGLSQRNGRQDIIIVASLIDKVPNLAGLARTCEIFRAKSLVLGDVSVTRMDAFKNIAASATDWVPLVECPETALPSFLLQKKREGWSIFALEQTNTSTSLATFAWPEKSVLVLGREKEGVPAGLLNLVDGTIEIPQLGVLRSLNVHVSGALALFEYTKQRHLGLLQPR